MTSIDEFKKSLLEASETNNEKNDQYMDIARRVINVHRQSYYGDESSSRRLSKIRELISDAAKRDV